MRGKEKQKNAECYQMTGRPDREVNLGNINARPFHYPEDHGGVKPK